MAGVGTGMAVERSVLLRLTGVYGRVLKSVGKLSTTSDEWLRLPLAYGAGCCVGAGERVFPFGDLPRIEFLRQFRRL